MTSCTHTPNEGFALGSLEDKVEEAAGALLLIITDKVSIGFDNAGVIASTTGAVGAGISVDENGFGLLGGRKDLPHLDLKAST